MTSSCVQLSKPLDQPKLETLARAASVAEKEGIQPLLVGAFARDVLFWHMHGIETGRRTEDVDVSIQLPDWDSFDRFVHALFKGGFSQPKKDHPEKFRDDANAQELDLLPFGQLSEDGVRITWREDGTLWTIIGLEDALHDSLGLKVEAAGRAHVLRLITIPSLAVLKIVAIHDRPEDRKNKDGADIGLVLENYLAAGNRERLRKKPHDDILRIVEGDLDHASALLLGRDIGSTTSKATRNYIVSILQSETSGKHPCPLAQALRKHCRASRRFQDARKLLSIISAGIESSTSSEED